MTAGKQRLLYGRVYTRLPCIKCGGLTWFGSRDDRICLDCCDTPKEQQQPFNTLNSDRHWKNNNQPEIE